MESPAALDARAIFDAGVAAVEPSRLVITSLARESLTPPVHVLAAGKAALGMARGALVALGQRSGPALVVVPRGYPKKLAVARVITASHPLPGPDSVLAARAALAFVRTQAEGSLLGLVSGGATALLSFPVRGVRIGNLHALTAALLGAAVPIEEVNVVRRSLLRLADGRLGAAARARDLLVLAISDVPGDRPEDIGSGPFHPGPTGRHEARRILERYGLERAAGKCVLAALAREEPPPERRAAPHRIVGSVQTALAGAAAEARRLGYRVVVARTRLAGDAARTGRRVARAILGRRGHQPTCLLWGGETTAALGGGGGKGGRAQELALAAAIALAAPRPAEGAPVLVLAAGTDGVDGPTTAAGAWADAGSVARAATARVDAATALARHDSYRFFAAAGGLVVTGPTGTNVGDLVVALRR